VDTPFDNLTFQPISFDDEIYSVYGYSHLPYGHNEARKLVEDYFAGLAPSGSDAANPCYLIGYNATVSTLTHGDVYFYGKLISITFHEHYVNSKEEEEFKFNLKL
jgi:hypothetical protein